MLFRRRWVILVVFLAVVGIAGFMAYRAWQNRSYYAASQVLVDLKQVQTSVTGIPQDQEGVIGYQGNTIRDEIYLLNKSEPLTRKAGEKMKQRLEQEGTPADYPVLLGGRAVQDLTPMQIGYRGRLMVSFQTVKETGKVLDIAAASPSAAEAALVANAFAMAYHEITQQVSLDKLSSSEEVLQELANTRRQTLDELNARKQSFLESNPTVTLNASGASLVEELMQLENQKREVERGLGELSANLSSLREQRDGIRRSMSDLTVQRTKREYDAEIARLNNVRALRENRVRSNPNPAPGSPLANEIRAFDQQIEQFEASTERLYARYSEALIAAGGIVGAEESVDYLRDLDRSILDAERQVRARQATLQSLEQDLRRLTGELNHLPYQQRTLYDIEREISLAEADYNNAVKTLRGNDLQQSIEGGYVTVLQPAYVPPAPLPSGASKILILGSFLGLLLGGGLAFVLELSSNRLYKQEDVEKLDVNVLDFLPFTDALSKKNRKKRVPVGNHEVSGALVALFSPFGPYVEALRKLEASIEFAVPAGRSFLVTSSRPAEGKSITTANLAVLFARSGRRTLLIDGDMRRPQVHDLFGIPNEKGLANVLTPGDGASVYDVTVDMGIENLRLLPSGQSGRISTELVRSERFVEVLEALKDEYDIVLVDTPPILAISDAEVMAPHVDGVLVMCRAGMTRAGELVSALDSLKRTRANVVGAVLNGFKITMAYGYRYRYGKYAGKGYYGYGYEQHTNGKA